MRDGDWTVADLEALPDDGQRYEIVDGLLHVTPSPVVRHQLVVARLSRLLVAACPAGREVLTGPLDVLLDERSVLQPDLLVVEGLDHDALNVTTGLVLAVEVLSPGTRRMDLVTKRERLQRAGCPSYWVVDPAEPSLRAWDLVDGSYVEVGHVTGDEPWSATQPFPVTLVPARLAD